MRYYSVAELTVTDRGWVRDYVAHVTPMVERYGGRYLARTPKVERSASTAAASRSAVERVSVPPAGAG